MSAFENIIKKVAEHYNLNLQSYRLLRRTKDKNMDRLVFQLETMEGTYIIKNPPISEKQLPFFIEAQQYLFQQGVKISEIALTSKKEATCNINGNQFVLFKYIEGRHVYPLRLEEVRLAIRTMGELHAKSKGFLSTSKKVRNSTLTNWIKEYSKIISKLQKWHSKQKGNKKPNIQPLLIELSFFINTAKEMKKRIEEIHLQKKEIEFNYIAHGDFTMGNIIFTEEGAYLIDFDKIRNEFPSKDFNLFYRRLMKYQEKRVATTFKEMLKIYEQVNPLPFTSRELFLVDLTFPHYVEDIVRKKRYLSMSHKEVNELVKMEMERTKYLIGKLDLL